MADDRIRDILSRASALADTDLVAIFKAKHTGQSESQSDELATVRAQLPNQRTREQFDREIKKQEKVATKETSGQRAFRLRKRNKRALAKLKKRLEQKGVKEPAPTLIPAHLWEQTQRILADASGWAAKYYSRLCKHKIGMSFIHRAALCFDADNKPRYSYSGTSRESSRARSVLAVGLLLVGLSEPSSRRKQGWQRLVSGIPQSAIVAAIRDPWTGEQVHRNTLDGTHRPREGTAGDVGYLTALYRIGFCYSRQAKWREGEDPADLKGWANIRPEEKLGEPRANGWFTSLNRYWIVSERYTDVQDAARRAELYVAWLASEAYPEVVSFDEFERHTEQTQELAREAPS